ncbi:hypothetical protein RQP46_011216 [Phenoliferia psychrophenolica]
MPPLTYDNSPPSPAPSATPFTTSFAPSSPQLKSKGSTSHAPATKKKSFGGIFSPSIYKPSGKIRRRALVVSNPKVTSKSPPSELPATWEDYSALYGQGDLDIEDPPLPPMRAAMEAIARKYLPPTPFDERVWVAPNPPNESVRQAVVNQLDVFGTLRGADGTSSSTSLEDLPAFQRIVATCRGAFDARIGMLTILSGEQQLFLATGGMPEGVDSLPRGSVFCSHTVLNEDRGMVILDSQTDWRFANNMPSAVLGTRFYAGVPLLAPSFGDPNSTPIALGTLCVMDDQPHADFTDAQREQLREYAAEATLEIERWAKTHAGDNLSRLEGLFQEATLGAHLPSSPSYASVMDSPAFPPSTFTAPSARASPNMNSPAFVPAAFASPSTRAGAVFSSPAFASDAFSAPSFTSSSTPTSKAATTSDSRAKTPARQAKPPPGPTVSLPMTPPPSTRNSSSSNASSASRGDESSDANRAGVARESSEIKSNRGLTLRTVTDNPVSLVTKEVQNVFDTASRMLAKSLKLPLVYIVSIDLADSAHDLNLLSSFGLSTPAPAFDPALHFKALRAPEGGLLYENSKKEGGTGMASGILIPIMEVRRVGYVLAGYTADRARSFTSKDMKLFVKFAEQLEPWVSRVGRA